MKETKRLLTFLAVIAIGGGVIYWLIQPIKRVSNQASVAKSKEREPHFSAKDTDWLTDDNLEYILKNMDIPERQQTSEPNTLYAPAAQEVQITDNAIITKDWKIRTDIANIYNAFYKAKTGQEWDLAEFLQELEINKTKYTIFPLRVSGNHWGMFILEDLGIEYRVYYTSSLHPTSEAKQIKALIQQITDQGIANQIKIIEPTSKQTNGYGCGVYLFFYIRELLTTGKLELKNSITTEQCQQFRKEWKTKTGAKWCKWDKLHENDIKGDD